MSAAPQKRVPAFRTGFTLMETLVMLLLVSFASALMFQMLGSYRIARERFLIQGEQVNRQALLESWFADSVRGLHPVGERPLRGDAQEFSSITLSPLFGPRGAPAPFAWKLELFPGQGWRLSYSENGGERFGALLRDVAEASFVYLDAGGAIQPRWPPSLGAQNGLPAAVALLRRDDRGRETQRVVAVLGPLEERIDPYQPEVE